MKTVIKLILIYYLLQIFGSLVAAPCVMVYEFATTGTLDVTAASTEVIIPAMLLGFVFIAIYLWKNGYLVDDGRIYAFTPYSQLGWGLLAGVSGICLTDALMSQLTFLPDLMKQTFDTCAGRIRIPQSRHESVVAEIFSCRIHPYFRSAVRRDPSQPCTNCQRLAHGVPAGVDLLAYTESDSLHPHSRIEQQPFHLSEFELSGSGNNRRIIG